jgi:DNA-binding beta-propeller fold protein YncE
MLVLVPAPPASASFVAFESGSVRPLALSADGTHLFAVNTPDNRLEIFAVTADGLVHQGSVPVGLEPVAVAAYDQDTVWVVNHLSDSVSIVDLSAAPPRVVRTLLVGDEPRDIVFAGPGRSRAFITAAHRGQNVPFDPQLTTPDVGRADVWGFDTTQLGPAFGGVPLTIITLFGDTPRGLAASADGTVVYAAVFHSGNQTTSLNEHTVCDGGVSASCSIDGIAMPGGLPDPVANVEGIHAPEVGLIVKFNPTTGAWEDELGRDWRAAVRFNLPDQDVFSLDAIADPPHVVNAYPGVGTILFNLAVNPVSGVVYVTNTDAHNEVRFAGPGVLAGHSVRGHLHEARITVIDPSTGAVRARHLNKHIDYGVVPSPAGVKERSLATPLEMALSSDGERLYVAAFGSSKIGVFHTAELESDTFVPDAAAAIPVSGGGPAGVVLDEARHRLYTLTRFDNAVAAIDTDTRHEVDHIPLHNPEPSEIINGRRFLYDATFTSSNGEASCAACHVFGDVDDLGWDLGNPDDKVQVFGNHFHPMKGPMTVQTLRGIATHGPLHWRGDRNAANVGGDPLDTRLAFLQFNEAFENLLGRDAPLTDDEMGAYADFVLGIIPPPNPIRSLDDTLRPSEAEGLSLLQNGPGIGCSCHVLSPASGFFGTSGMITIALETQEFKVPQLRNMYARVGMFGMAGGGMFGVGGTAHTGDQIRGFGYLHDGSVDTLFRFLGASIFSLSEQQRRRVEEFLLVFPSNLAPAVGQQVTLSDRSDADAMARVDLLALQCRIGACDLIAKGERLGESRGWVMDAQGMFRSDRVAEPLLADSDLRALASAAQPLTYTCAPPGSGVRIGIDRDDDGIFDRDEIDRCGDPTDPATPPRLAQACLGDCNRDCVVTIDELIRGVGVGLNTAPLDQCVAFDGDFDGTVAISELVQGIGRSLNGC